MTFKLMTTCEKSALYIKYLWHPCTDIDGLEQRRFPVIERASGVYLYEVGGRPCSTASPRGGASTWVTATPDCRGHPRAGPELQHAILGGMSHPNAIKLAEQLAQITPG